MNPLKVVFDHRRSRIWAITSVVLLALGITVSTLAMSPEFYSLICIPLGGERAITAKNKAVYTCGATSKADAFTKANAANVTLCEEGAVLLKNEGKALPLSAGAKISVFGKNAANIVRGGSGSSGGNTDQEKTLYDSLESAGFSLNPTLRSFYDDNSLSGSGRSDNPPIEETTGNASLIHGQTPQASYPTNVKDSYASYADAAIVVLSRIGGEGFDLPRHMDYDQNRHYLELDNNEKDLLAAVCQANFSHVIVLINSASPMELGFLNDATSEAYQAKVDGALWIGYGGGQGVMAVGELLSGSVTPSGHLVDTYLKDFTANPTYVNFGNNGESGGDQYTYQGKAKLRYFVDYEEGIYLGYRYVETRAVSAGENWYESMVAYPFGYGLSYTTFSWSEAVVENPSSLAADSSFKISVDVTNTGNAKGKDVVEVFAEPPYQAGGIEKSAKVLAGFAKTKLLNPGEKDTVSISVNPYYLASYDYNDKNGNGFSGYELEQGDYRFDLSSDSHHVVSSFTKTLASAYRYEKDPTTGMSVVNRFADADDHLQSVLSRSDWTGTYPAKPTEQDRVLDSDTLTAFDSSKSGNPLEDKSDVAMPSQSQSGTLTLADMKGVSYDDKKWDSLLNELSASEMLDMFTPSAFHTKAVASIGKPKTNESDGATGFTNFMSDPTIYGTCWFASEAVVASSWNVEMARLQGEALGDEGLIGNEKGDGMPYSGWYAPGVNLHRSPFGGRTSEYYSEDPLLSGKMAAALIQGSKEKGIYAFMKHFALNEQETHRAVNGDSTWVNEQAMRELYLRGFEIAVKEGEALGAMSSFNRIGTRWAGGDYRLLNEVLRQEWGFHGAVISDFNTNSYMVSHQMLYAGGDIDLASQSHAKGIDTNKASDVVALRSASKNLLYVVANSNVLNVAVSGYRMPIWEEVLWIVDSLLLAGIIAWGIGSIRHSIRIEKGLISEKKKAKETH